MFVTWIPIDWKITEKETQAHLLPFGYDDNAILFQRSKRCFFLGYTDAHHTINVTKSIYYVFQVPSVFCVLADGELPRNVG